MVHDGIEFHNIPAFGPLAGRPGRRLQRLPENLRKDLNPGARVKMNWPANVELRFVLEDPEQAASIALSSKNGEGRAYLLWGDYLCDWVGPIHESPESFHIEMPATYRNGLSEGVLGGGGAFAPTVARLCLAGRDEVYFHGASGKLRPPVADELPSLRLLHYGTSITMGTGSSTPHWTFPFQTARILGTDFLNLGMGGSAHCEPALADYLAAREDWQVATLEMSVNMIDAFSAEDFQMRAGYFVDTLAQADSDRPVIAISILPHFRDWGPYEFAEKVAVFRQILEEVVDQSPHQNVYFMEGSDLLDQLEGLTPDLIHPSDKGYARMAENLADFVRKIASVGT